jgi:DNA-binding SARP family transcriptional activator
MQFRVLGPLEIENDNSLLPLRGAKQRALLALLLMHPNQVLSRDLLIDGLWGETADERAGHSLEAQVSRLRKSLRPAGSQILLTRGTGYQLNVEADELDVLLFERLLEQAESALGGGDAAGAAATIRGALALWRGRPFEDVAYESFAQIEIERLEELRLGALEDRIDAELALGGHAQLVPELEAMVRKHPLRERFRAQLILALYRSGRQAEALAAYQDVRRALVDELGIEPGPALRELEQAILRQDVALRSVERERLVLMWGDRDERHKTVTVLFSEIEAAGRDDEDPHFLERVLHGAAHELRVAVEYHGGTVERLAGGELMVVFGVPIAHEDDVLRAARSALGVADAVDALTEIPGNGPGIECRTAIATGLVRVVPASERPDLSGPVLATVRRLAETAAVGEILVDVETAVRAGGALTTEPAEPRTLRGHAKPLSVVRLVSVAAASALRRPAATRFVGRSSELSEVRSAFGTAVEERRCLVATIVGEAGIGKSRLVSELSEGLAVSASLFTGKCVSYGDGATFLPLAEIVTQAAGARPAAEIERLLGDDDDAGLIGGRIEELTAGSASDGSTGEAFWAVRRLFERLAQDRPLVLVFEDVHWAEPTLLDLIEYLGRWSRGTPVLVLCLACPDLVDERPVWPGETLIRLGPLSEEEMLELVDSAGGRIADELRARIAELAAGNPLFAEQLIAFAGDQPSPALAGVPPSVDAVLSSRLDLLAEPERAVLQRAAVVGRDFWHGALLRLSPPLDVPGVGRILLELSRKGLIERGTSALPREDSFRFRHVLIRDVAYNAIPQELRAELHERLVDWLDLQNGVFDELAGYHLEQAFRCRCESGQADGHARRLAADAGGRLGGAGLRAAKFGDTHAAANLLERASSLLAGEEVAGRDLLTELGLVRWQAGEVAVAESTLIAACEVAIKARDRRGELRARVELANLNLFRSPEGGADALMALMTESVPLLEELYDARALGRIWYVLAFVRGGLHCRYRESAAAAERAAAYFRQSGWPVAPCMQELGAALYYGPTQVPEAIRLCRELLDGADRGSEAHLTGFLACLEAMGGRFDAARELVLRARTIYEELAWTVNVTTNYASLAADIELLAGDAVAAERLLAESCRTLEEWGERAHLATQAAQLGEALYAQRRYEEALRLAKIAAGCAASDDIGAQFSWRALRAKALAQRGLLDEGEMLAREAVELAAATDTLTQRASVLFAHGEVLGLSGRAPEAAQAVEEACALLDAKGNEVASRRVRA